MDLKKTIKHLNRSLVVMLIISTSITCCRKPENKNPDAELSDQIEASVSEFENRKKYSSFNPRILKSIPDDKLEMAVIDYITDVKLKDKYDNEYAIISGMSRGFRYIYITWNLESEVNNGGFIQYFYNTSGIFAADLADALRNIKGYKTEKIANNAIAVYNKEISIHKRTKKDTAMDSFMDPDSESELDRLDDLFYKSGEDLSKLRIKYIRDNSREFITE